MSIRTAALLTAAIALAGCHPDEYAEPTYETHAHELAVQGPWEPDALAVATADSYNINYTGAGAWVGTSGCSGTFTPGGQQLKDWISANWPQVSTIGGYACRPIVGNSSSMSVHGTGRAIDIHIPTDGGQADNGLGDPLANWLIEHADEIGIQMVIWDRWLWSPSREPRSRYYGGAHAHHDHLHVELTVAGGNMQTPWFQGSQTAPQASDCDAVPAAGRIVDETDDCFVAFGPSQYWRLENSGMSGSLLWTNAFESSNPSNWARWNFDLETGGDYIVEYHNNSSLARFDSVRYRVRAGSTETDVYTDQSADPNGWNELGTFTFTAGNNQWVSIYDNVSTTVAEDQHIVVDAVRIRPVGSTPPPGPSDETTEPEGGPQTTIEGDDSTSPDAPGNLSSEEQEGTAASAPTGNYGNDSSSGGYVPPKGSVEAPSVPESHDHDDYEAWALGAESPPVHSRGHACSTTAADDAPPGHWLLLLSTLGFVRLRRRRR